MTAVLELTEVTMSLTGSTSRHCYAIGCTNGDYRLRKWRDSICDTHGDLKEKCFCPPPFELFTFPTKKKDKEKRQRWIHILKRASSSNSFKYQDPSLCHRLCSDHFIDGRPTEQNPDPVLKLGHSLKHPIKASGSEGRYSKRLCNSDEETYPAELVIETDINPPTSCISNSTTYTLPVLKVAIHFFINIFLSLIRKYKYRIKVLEEENILLKAKINILKQQQSSSARTKSISLKQPKGACSQKRKLST